jgi:tetratricopeptide (TPR) repeat protein
MTGDFPGTLAALNPIPDQIDAKQQLAYVYAVSLVKTGKYDEGLTRLLALAKAEPRNADIHTALGEAYTGESNFKDAARELQASIAIDSKDAVAYCLLGAIQMAQADLPQAITNLETAVKLDPGRAEYHRQLALAYRKALKHDDADREQAAYEALNKERSSSAGSKTY